jgi:hypothetical protein
VSDPKARSGDRDSGRGMGISPDLCDLRISLDTPADSLVTAQVFVAPRALVDPFRSRVTRSVLAYVGAAARPMHVRFCRTETSVL